MPAKTKKGRARTFDINKFNEHVVDDDNLDWADDTWNQAGEEGGAEQVGAEKSGKSYREFSRMDKNTLGDKESFRTASQLTPSVDLSNLSPPYVAHFGNIRNNIHDETFLALFNKDVVVTHFLVKQESRTFGYVEFTTADAIRCALTLNGSFVHGRKLFVDLATPKQIERLYNRGEQPQQQQQRTGPVFSRENAGQAQPEGESMMMMMNRGGGGGGSGAGGGAAAISRDAFGASQPDKESGMSNFGNNNNSSSNRFGDSGSPPNSPLSRSQMGAKMGGFPPGNANSNSTSQNNDTHTLDDFSRDAIGSAVQPSRANPPLAGSQGKFSGNTNNGHGRNSISSPLSVSAGSGFANWRNEQAVAQPVFVDQSEERKGVGSESRVSSRSGGTATNKSNNINKSSNDSKNDEDDNDKSHESNVNENTDANECNTVGAEAAPASVKHDANRSNTRSNNSNGNFSRGGFRGMGETGAAAGLSNWRDEPRAAAAPSSSSTAPFSGHRGRGRGGHGPSMPQRDSANNVSERAARHENRQNSERPNSSSPGSANGDTSPVGGRARGGGNRGKVPQMGVTESAGAGGDSAERWASLRN